MWYAICHIASHKRATREMTMSTATTHLQPGIYGVEKPAHPRKLLAGLLTVWQGLVEGLAAARRYQELTARGLPHEEAAAKVFHEHYAGK
jgi:hypothetical protein